MITATGYSRLNELRKIKQSSIFSEKYIGGGSFVSDGVDYNISVENNVVYYVGGLKYNDITSDGVTTTTIQYNATPISYVGGGNLYRDFFVDGEYTQPKINNDVFILRQDVSGFNDNYMLDGILNILELETFASGNYFNIKNNT